MTNTNIVLGYGELGQEIVKQTGWDYISRKRDKFDFANLDTYITKIYKYDTVINCIGDTKTYSIERDNHWEVNYGGVVQLANYCARTRMKLVQMSTDYVYAGSVPNATEEDVPANCRNWYTYTKLLADGYVQNTLRNYLLIRTSFKPRPFPYDVAITTQVGNFDYVDVIAGYIIKLINKGARGVFNVGTEEKSIYDLAIRTKPDVIPTNRALHITMPTDITMNVEKMKEFLNDD
jgi:dTDP-4-dehydrorhamnose reductase